MSCAPSMTSSESKRTCPSLCSPFGEAVQAVGAGRDDEVGLRLQRHGKELKAAQHLQDWCYEACDGYTATQPSPFG